MKKVLLPILAIWLTLCIDLFPIKELTICRAQPTKLELKSGLSHIEYELLDIKKQLSISSCHALDVIPYEEPEEEIEVNVYEYILTVDDYFNMFPDAVKTAFYDMGWDYTKVDYDIGPEHGFDHILGITIWADKQIYVNYQDSANAAILHEVGHAFEYSPYVKGVKSEEFMSIYQSHWEEWYYNYGMHINNYNTPEEGYAQCWEIYMLKPWCLDDETRAFIESEIYGVG